MILGFKFTRYLGYEISIGINPVPIFRFLILMIKNKLKGFPPISRVSTIFYTLAATPPRGL